MEYTEAGRNIETPATHREEEVLAGGAAIVVLGGAAIVALCIIGLAGAAPQSLLAVASIVAGGTLLLGATGTGARAKEIRGRARALAGGGASIEFIGGVAGVVLGILALIGFSTVLLCEIAALAMGGALLLSSMLPARPGVFGIRQPTGYRAGEGAGAMQGLGGIGAVTLAILALAGVSPLQLTLIAELGIGASLMLTGGALLAGSALTMRSAEV